MRILDRYVLRSFLMNYLISFFVLIGMYIVLDMVFAFDELAEVPQGMELNALGVAMRIGEYYFYQTFLIFAHLSGVIPVVAAGFTLVRLSRFNELTAILAAGRPLLRVAAPIIFAGVVLQCLLLVDMELIIPNIIPKVTRAHDEIYRKSAGKSFPVQAMQDGQQGLLFAGRFEPANPAANEPAILREVDIMQIKAPEFQPESHITAEKAEWDDAKQHWRLTKGRIVSGLLPTQKTELPKAIHTYKSNITPDEIALYHSSEFVQMLSREKINELLKRRNVYGARDLLRVKHFRLSQLVLNVVMLLIAIPCMLTREPGRLKTLIFRCLVLVGLCMASYFIAYQVAGSPPLGPQWADRWPAMMAMVPIVVFFPLAVLLLEKLPT